MFNPYFPQYNQQIIKVNGENGANAYQLPPNCSALLLDETAPRLFLAQTDGAGYKTISAYKLEPYVPEPPVNVNELAKRLKKLEGMINAKSNTSDVRGKKTESNNGKTEHD